MKYALLLPILILLFFMLYEWSKEIQSNKRNRYLTILILLLPFSAFAQAYNGLEGIPPDLLEATLDPPKPIQEHFEFVSPIFIEISEYDTIYQQRAVIFVDSSEFFLIRGTDTLSRRICNYQHNYMELKLSCGDYIKPVRDVNGIVYALWYKEGTKKYFFAKKWRKEYIKK